MAKVKILESCAGLDFSYSANEVIEENEHTQGLINAGLAEWTDKPLDSTPTGEGENADTKEVTSEETENSEATGETETSDENAENADSTPTGEGENADTKEVTAKKGAAAKNK